MSDEVQVINIIQTVNVGSKYVNPFSIWKLRLEGKNWFYQVVKGIVGQNNLQLAWVDFGSWFKTQCLFFTTF